MQGNKPTDKPTDTQAYCDCFWQHRSQRIHWTADGGVCQTCGLPMPTEHAGELPTSYGVSPAVIEAARLNEQVMNWLTKFHNTPRR